jgi:hypothetical protein
MAVQIRPSPNLQDPNLRVDFATVLPKLRVRQGTTPPQYRLVATQPLAISSNYRDSSNLIGGGFRVAALGSARG